MTIRRCWLLIALGIVCGLLASCEGARAPLVPVGASLRPPTYDAAFRKLWNDGASEVSSFASVRLRDGVLREATSTSILKRTNYAEDERVPAAPSKLSQSDLFPALQWNWIDRYAIGRDQCEEMTTSVLALSSIEGRVAATETKADFSSQSWDGQLFHQLLFDATGVRSHQYSYFESEGDEQITLAYPSDGVPGDALWFWARHMGAPTLQPGESKPIMLLPALRDARARHIGLDWERAALSRGASHSDSRGKPVEVFTLRSDSGYSETFLVEPELPFQVLHWENSRGEHTDYLSTSREQGWTTPPMPSRKAR